MQVVNSFSAVAHLEEILLEGRVEREGQGGKVQGHGPKEARRLVAQVLVLEVPVNVLQQA